MTYRAQLQPCLRDRPLPPAENRPMNGIVNLMVLG